MYFRDLSIFLLRPAFLLGLGLLLHGCGSTPTPKIDIKPPSEQPTIKAPEPKEPEVLPLPEPKESLPEVSEKQTFTIAALLPLSGKSADLGKQILQGAEIALYRYGKEDQNLRIYDTQGRRFTAMQAAKDAVSDGADIVIGPLFSHSTKAVMPLLKENNIPLISFSNNNALLETHPAEGGFSAHILGVTPQEELRQLIESGASSGVQNFALIAPDDDYGQQIYRDMQQILYNHSVDFTRVVLYDPAHIDFSEPVQRISDYRERRNAYKQEVQRLRDSGITAKDEIERLLKYKETFGPVPFDAVVLITYDDNSLRTLAAQLEYYEVDPETVQYMGLRQWQNFANLHVEPSLRGSWFVGLDPKSALPFARLHQTLYQEPAQPFAALGFDAVAMIAHFGAIHTNPVPQLLQQRQGILGATGAYRLEHDGTVSRKMALFEITPEGVQVRLDAEDGWN